MTMREYAASFSVVVVKNTCGLRFKWVCIDGTYYVNAEYAQEFRETRERLIRKYETASDKKETHVPKKTAVINSDLSVNARGNTGSMTVLL